MGVFWARRLVDRKKAKSVPEGQKVECYKHSQHDLDAPAAASAQPGGVCTVLPVPGVFPRSSLRAERERNFASHGGKLFVPLRETDAHFLDNTLG